MKMANSLARRIAEFDWQRISSDIDTTGYACIPDVLISAECERLIEGYDDQAFRKTVPMARYRFGQGEYKYWQYPLPDIVQTLRTKLFPFLVPIVNDWHEKLNIDQSFSTEFDQLQQRCHEHKQLKPTPLILKYGQGGYNTLHQDLYGSIFFPLQAVINLTEPGQDFDGGEFVLTEQIPRAQSRAIVLNPGRGDMVIFTTNYRPIKGSRGYYRAKMRHGVSEVRRGHRSTVGIIFHDAES